MIKSNNYKNISPWRQKISVSILHCRITNHPQTQWLNPTTTSPGLSWLFCWSCRQPVVASADSGWGRDSAGTARPSLPACPFLKSHPHVTGGSREHESRSCQLLGVKPGTGMSPLRDSAGPRVPQGQGLSARKRFPGSHWANEQQ